MKEQINIDNIPELIKEMAHSEPIAFIRLCLSTHHEFSQSTFDKLAKEYERLKRLDEVVKLYLTDLNKSQGGLSKLVEFVDKLRSLCK